MNKMKSIILSSIIIIIVGIIIIAITILIINKEQAKNTNEYYIEKNLVENEEEFSVELQRNLTRIKDNGMYYNGLYYIKSYLNKIDIEASFYPEKAYYRDINEMQTLYIYDGKILKDESIQAYSYGIIIDYENMCYKIIEGDSIEQINSMNYQSSIEKNDFNTYEYKYIEDVDICRNLFDKFKFDIIYNSDIIYNKLNEEYRQKRFNDNIENYNKYIANIQNKISDSVITGYQVETISETEKRYIVEDNYKNQYIFIEDDNLEYTIMLDRYTILDNDYRISYNALNNESKANTNVDIFIKMINSLDYEHAYEKLDSTFKQNNFNTVSLFEEYVKNNFFENNLLTVDSIEKREDLYIVKTTLRSDSSSVAESKEKTFIVKLEEGTDFVMSFNIK